MTPTPKGKKKKQLVCSAQQRNQQTATQEKDDGLGSQETEKSHEQVVVERKAKKAAKKAAKGQKQPDRSAGASQCQQGKVQGSSGSKPEVDKNIGKGLFQQADLKRTEKQIPLEIKTKPSGDTVATQDTNVAAVVEDVLQQPQEVCTSVEDKPRGAKMIQIVNKQMPDIVKTLGDMLPKRPEEICQPGDGEEMDKPEEWAVRPLEKKHKPGKEVFSQSEESQKPGKVPIQPGIVQKAGKEVPSQSKETQKPSGKMPRQSDIIDKLVKEVPSQSVETQKAAKVPRQSGIIQKSQKEVPDLSKEIPKPENGVSSQLEESQKPEKNVSRQFEKIKTLQENVVKESEGIQISEKQVQEQPVSQNNVERNNNQHYSKEEAVNRSMSEPSKEVHTSENQEKRALHDKNQQVDVGDGKGTHLLKALEIAGRTKSKAELKAERRAKQEAQRAAKQQQKPEGKKHGGSQAGGTVGLLKQAKRVPDDVQADRPSVEKKLARTLALAKIPHRTKAQRKVLLFNHLHQYDRKASLTRDLPVVGGTMHPAIIRLGLQYAEGVVSGSNARCVALLKAMKQVISDYVTPPQKELSRDLDAKIKPYITFIKQCRPLSVSMGNAIRFLKWQINHLSSNISDALAKEKLLKAIENYVHENIYLAAEAISITAREKITDGDVILTYACSSLVKKILVDASCSGKKFRVVVVDGRPRMDGREMLRYLVNHGVKCSYVLLCAASYIMHEVTKVFLGAHGLLANGYVLGHVGSSQIALIAKAYNVPVMVCCEAYKFCERVQTDSFVFNELGDPDDLVQTYSCKTPLADWRDVSELTLLNLRYDVTPADLVTAVINELAILPCTSVLVVLRVRHPETI